MSQLGRLRIAVLLSGAASVLVGIGLLIHLTTHGCR